MKLYEFERFCIEMPDAAVIDCSHQGDCAEDVEHWSNILDRQGVSVEDLRAELRAYGAWDDEELADDNANWERLVWIAACNISEEDSE